MCAIFFTDVPLLHPQFLTWYLACKVSIEYVQQIQGRGYPRQEGGSGNSTHVLSIIPESLIIFKTLDEARCDGLCL